MIEEGEEAPTFELPGVRDGQREQVSLSEYLGDEILILAFYPGDFNPACSDGTTDLDELDLFTMQKDVSILALSADSVFSHRAFAEEYDLHIPLLSDAHGEVAAEYGVAVDEEGAGYLTRRAVVVLGPRSTAEYTWVASDIEELPPVDEIRDAIQSVGGDDTALARYRVGHAHYIEGRRAFTSAMEAFEEKEWMVAKGDFDRAYDGFDEAEDEFNTAARFAEDDLSGTYFEQAERKAESLWRAAEWLSDSANAFASGEGAAAQSMRKDAESPLETARDIHEPPSPGEFPPDEAPPDADDESLQLSDGDDASLDLAVDDEESVDSTPTEETGTPPDGAGENSEQPTAAGGSAGEGVVARGDGTANAAERDRESAAHTADERAGVAGREANGATASDGPADDAGDPEEGEEIDEEELEEIAAELEEQTEAAQEQQPDGIDDGNVVPDSIDVEAMDEQQSDEDSEPSPGADTGTDEEIDLDLTDPMESASEDEDEEEAEDDIDSEDLGGDHGVPDSL